MNHVLLPTFTRKETAMSMSFEDWKRKVNQFIEQSMGLSADDLPDCPYYDWYSDGIAPSRAAVKAMKYAMES